MYKYTTLKCRSHTIKIFHKNVKHHWFEKSERTLTITRPAAGDYQDL